MPLDDRAPACLRTWPTQSRMRLRNHPLAHRPRKYVVTFVDLRMSPGPDRAYIGDIQQA